MSFRNPSLPSRRSLRLHGYDYRQSGAYFVTICAYRKSCLFGYIRDGKLTPSDLGQTVARCWLKISQVRPSIELDAFVVMPNHVHGILFLFDEQPVDVSESSSRNTGSLPREMSRASLGIIVGQFKRAVTIRSKLLAQPPEYPIWQRNFYDHIIRNENSLMDIRKYIVENPGKWLDDSMYVD